MTSPSPRIPDGPSHGSRLVLIVDDNEMNRKLARDVLGAAGFRTLEAGTGAEAVVVANDQRPDVVLLDLRLPDMDGADVVRALRSRAGTARLVLVALSAMSVGDGEWLRDAGFDGYIEKPIRVADFPDQVGRLCRTLPE